MLAKSLTGLAIIIAFCDLSMAQIVRTSMDGGTVVTPLSYSKINDGSTLKRVWTILNDASCPVQLADSGVRTVYESDRPGYSGDYFLRPAGTLKATAAVTAVEVRFLLYDIFGEHIKTLSLTKVRDIEPEKPLLLKDVGSWRTWESEVRDLLSVVSFVALVRQADGTVWHHKEPAIVEELAKIRLSTPAALLSPTNETPGKPK